MNDKVIEFKDITKVFKTRRKTITALKDINLYVDKGEFVAIVGPSGCGKSTIIRILDDIIKPTSGEILVDGVRYEKTVPVETVQKMGFIFQSPNLLPWLTVRQNIEFPLHVLKKDVNEYKEHVDRLLNMIGMMQFADARPQELSQSMLQRVGVVRAMVHKPEILLMDEPFGSLDETMREQLNMELLDIWKEMEQSIVFITHNVAEAVLLADRVYIMATNPGRIVRCMDIDFPRPRTLDILMEDKFMAYEEEITNAIGELDLSKIV